MLSLVEENTHFPTVLALRMCENHFFSKFTLKRHKKFDSPIQFAKMIQIDNFLVVFSLEVGGKFIGFFALISNTIVLPLAILLLIAVSIDKDFQYIREQLELMDIQALNIPIPEASDEKAIKQLREYMILSLVLLIIISTIYIISGCLLIRGTKNVSLIQYIKEVLKKIFYF